VDAALADRILARALTSVAMAQAAVRALIVLRWSLRRLAVGRGFCCWRKFGDCGILAE